MQTKPFFQLFDAVRVVLGYKVSLLYDLQRGSYLEIPNLIANILLVNREKRVPIADLKKAYDNQHDKGIDAFLHFLESREKGLFYQIINFLGELNNCFKSELDFSNAIIEVSPLNKGNLKKLYPRLNLSVYQS
jgi:hypothetical protein